MVVLNNNLKKNLLKLYGSAPEIIKISIT